MMRLQFQNSFNESYYSDFNLAPKNPVQKWHSSKNQFLPVQEGNSSKDSLDSSKEEKIVETKQQQILPQSKDKSNLDKNQDDLLNVEVDSLKQLQQMSQNHRQRQTYA